MIRNKVIINLSVFIFILVTICAAGSENKKSGFSIETEMIPFVSDNGSFSGVK